MICTSTPLCSVFFCSSQKSFQMSTATSSMIRAGAGLLLRSSSILPSTASRGLSCLPRWASWIQYFKLICICLGFDNQNSLFSFSGCQPSSPLLLQETNSPAVWTPELWQLKVHICRTQHLAHHWCYGLLITWALYSDSLIGICWY